MGNRRDRSPRFAIYMALPGGGMVVTSAGVPLAWLLDVGFDVGTSSGLCRAWAAAGSSKANRQEMNPRARQDKAMMRIELERRKFFSVETWFNASRMLAGAQFLCQLRLVKASEDRSFAAPDTKNFLHAQTISLYMISPCQVSTHH